LHLPKFTRADIVYVSLCLAEKDRFQRFKRHFRLSSHTPIHLNTLHFPYRPAELETSDTGHGNVANNTPKMTSGVTLSHPSTSPALDPTTSPGPFEGPEKLLEVWFAPSADALSDNATASSSYSPRLRAPANGTKGYKGLRQVPKEVWEEMLDIVKCKVLSVVEGEDIDAYLLR
jgi:hypothetical protein